MVEDLSGDALLVNLKRIEYENRSLPSLGGIPLLRRIGRGAMGAVYYGVHPRLQNEVAVKVLPAALAQADPDLSKRLFREAQLAARIRSENLISVLDVNEENGIFYLIMEYVAGISAGDYLRARRKQGLHFVPEAEALEICIAATQGLAAAHLAGVIHRDIKPDNIMVPYRRDLPLAEAKDRLLIQVQFAKLADLGLAHLDELDSSLTATCIAMGTPGYLAPEQALDARNARKPADVFSMAATLYNLLAGQAPFTGETPLNIIIAAMQSKHKPVREVNPGVSEITAALLDKCLEKAPERRIPDGSALLRELCACRQGNGSHAEPPGSAPSRVAPPAPAAAVEPMPTRPRLPSAQAPGSQIDVPTLIKAAPVPALAEQKTELLPPPSFPKGASEPAALKTAILPPLFPEPPAEAAVAAPEIRNALAAPPPSPLPAPSVPPQAFADAPGEAPEAVEPAPPPKPPRPRHQPVPAAHRETLLELVRTILEKGKGELPAVQRFVGEVSTALMSDKTSGQKLAQLILKDATLTQSLLKTVNSLYYNPARQIETVSHAVLVLGVNTIAQLATCLTFLEQFKGREDLDDLRDSILRIMMSGKFACELAGHDPHTGLETAFIAGMMHNLGELLVAFHLSESYAKIKALFTHGNQTRPLASHRVLGATFHEIGREVAVQWNLAPVISDAMREFDPSQPPARNNRGQRLHALVSCAGELSESAELGAPEDRAQHIHEVLSKYEDFIKLSEKQRNQLKSFAETSLTEAACVVHVAGVRARRKQLAGPGAPSSSARIAIPVPPENAKRLQESLDLVARSLKDNFNLSEFLNLAVKGLFEGLKLDHIVLLLTTPNRDELRARLGFGPRKNEFMAGFQMPLDAAAGVLGDVLVRNRELVVPDIQKAGDVPAPFKALAGQGRFVMLPIMPLDKAIGALYAQRRSDDPAPLEFDLTQMRLFRDKIATAIRKSTGS